MPKLFAVFIPILCIIIVTISIALNSNQGERKVNKKMDYGLLIFGVILLLLLAGWQLK